MSETTGLTWLDIAALALRYGPEFVETILRNQEEKRPVSFDEWQALRLKIATPFDSLVPPVEATP